MVGKRMDMEDEQVGVNQMTKAVEELLYVLSEEAGEVVHIAQKSLRHGFKCYNPFDPNQVTNRDALTKEAGHVLNAISMLTRDGILDRRAVIEHALAKRDEIDQYLHYQEPRVPSDFAQMVNINFDDLEIRTLAAMMRDDEGY